MISGNFAALSEACGRSRRWNKWGRQQVFINAEMFDQIALTMKFELISLISSRKRVVNYFPGFVVLFCLTQGCPSVLYASLREGGVLRWQVRGCASEGLILYYYH